MLHFYPFQTEINQENMNIKNLKFIHITKCAGTAIETLGKKHSMQWGMFDPEYFDPENQSKHRWHQLFVNIPQDVQNKYDWFIVVRNPYDRILSEYYCKWGSYCRPNHEHPDQMSKYLINKIKNRNKNGCHFTEMYSYIKNSDKKIFVLKFENISTEFNRLMEVHQSNLTLPSKRYNQNNYGKFSVNDFSDDLVKIINQVYKDDFNFFNYEMKTSSVEEVLSV